MEHIDHDDIRHDDIARRLRSLGEQPVEPGTVDRHASYLAAAAPVTAHRRRRPAVTAAFVAGIVLGGTGLAAAVPGPLPTQASNVARAMVGAEDKDAAKEAGKEARAQAKADRTAAKAAKHAGGHGVERYHDAAECPNAPDVPYNHGQYVKANPDNPDTPAVNERQVAAESRCGKPIQATDNPGDDAVGTEQNEGKPEGAGKPEVTDKPADTGRPESPGNSEGPRPPAVAEDQQGSDNRNDDPDRADGAKAEGRPEGVGPPASGS